jgi:hypothetical protein
MTIVMAALLTLGAGALATQVRIDVNPLNLQDPDTEAVRAYRDLASRPQLSPYALNIAAPTLAAARDLVRRLETVLGVQEARTIDDLVPENQDEKRSLLSSLARGLANPPANAQQKPDGPELRQSFEELRRNVERRGKTTAGTAPSRHRSTPLRMRSKASRRSGAPMNRPFAHSTRRSPEACRSWPDRLSRLQRRPGKTSRSTTSHKSSSANGSRAMVGRACVSFQQITSQPPTISRRSLGACKRWPLMRRACR